MEERILSLIDNETWTLIKKVKILIVGIGGVGGYALEALVRSGFSNITIIDGDTIALSNLNRQIITNLNNIGLNKVDEALKRAHSINDQVNIKTHNIKLNLANFKDYVNEKYDYIIDACDDLIIKIELIKYAKVNNIKIISCLGMGKRIDARKVEVTTLNKTFNCPLAKKLRYNIKKENIDLNIPVVFSKEEVLNNDKTIGSLVFVPAVAGIYLANYVFKDIYEKNIS